MDQVAAFKNKSKAKAKAVGAVKATDDHAAENTVEFKDEPQFQDELPS